MCCIVKGTVYGLIYIALQIVVLVIFILVTPFDTLRIRPEKANIGFGGASPPYAEDASFRDLPCFTVWNYRTTCGTSGTGQSFGSFTDGNDALPLYCSKQRSYFIAAAAMVALTIAFAVLAVFNGACALLSCFQYKCCAFVFALVTAAFAIASWALILSLYEQRMCSGVDGLSDAEAQFRHKDAFTLGSSFILMVVGSGVQILALLVVIMA